MKVLAEHKFIYPVVGTNTSERIKTPLVTLHLWEVCNGKALEWLLYISYDQEIQSMLSMQDIHVHVVQVD